MRAGIVALAMLLAFAGPLAAEDVTVGGKALSLEPPAGSCTYDRGNVFDAAAMQRAEDAQAGKNQVVLQFGRCDEFPQWRTGAAAFSEFGRIMLPLNYPGAPQPLPLSRQKYLDIMAPKVPKLDPVDVERIEDQPSSKITNSQASGPQLLGLLDQDQNGLYVGFLGVLEVGGKKYPLAGVGAVTMLGSVPASVNLYRPMGKGAFDKLIDAQKAYVAELIRKNP
ncbi:hypothetical protein [Hypericibacter sp.]|uniref:hypothetical protein n=1 Tax=Hypericibacter sp. TaxID=2705401 RepID=UPI003D6CE733